MEIFKIFFQSSNSKQFSQNFLYKGRHKRRDWTGSKRTRWLVFDIRYPTRIFLKPIYVRYTLEVNTFSRNWVKHIPLLESNSSKRKRINDILCPFGTGRHTTLLLSHPLHPAGDVPPDQLLESIWSWVNEGQLRVEAKKNGRKGQSGCCREAYTVAGDRCGRHLPGFKTSPHIDRRRPT